VLTEADVRNHLCSLVLLVAGCGGGHYTLQGDCSPPAGTSTITIDPNWIPQFPGTCLLPPGSTRSAPFEEFRSRAAFEARVDVASCPTLSVASIDFTSTEVLLIGGYDLDSSGGGVLVRNVSEDAANRYLGLLTQPVGFPPPDFLVRLPASPKPIVLRWCHDVCVGNCDKVP
jgi:hypothetical protein